MIKRLSASTVGGVLRWLLPVACIFLLDWRAFNLRPEAGLDNSWRAGLAMAAHFGVTFGNHLVFTYGPLGFLDNTQVWYSDIARMAFVYLVLVRLVLAIVIYAGARRSFGGFVGLLVAIVVVGLSDELLDAAVFIAAVYLVQVQPGRRVKLLSMAVAGGFAAFEMLVKIGPGIEFTAITVVLIFALEGSRVQHAAVAASGFLAVLLGGWALAGQSFGAFPEFVGYSTNIVSGYATAMGVDALALGWQYAGALAMLLMGLVAAWYVTGAEPPRRRMGVLALWVTFVFFEFKEGFQRHDAGHGEFYFSALLGAFLAFRFRAGQRLIGLGLVGIMIVFTLAAQEEASQSWIYQSVRDPPANVNSAFTQFKEMSDARELRRFAAEGRAGVIASAGLNAQALALLRGKTVHFAPYEIAWAWAYQLDWRPLPVFQSYSTYTTGLDRLNARMIDSDNAPQRIVLTRSEEIDRRLPTFDEPLTELKILCRYQELYANQSWAVLGVGPNRCGRPIELSMVKAGWGQKVSVPSPSSAHTLIVARVSGVQVGGLERLGAALYKARDRFVLIDSGRYRLVPGTAEDGLMLAAPSILDFAQPFKIAPNTKSIAVQMADYQPGGDPITYTFYAVPVSVGPRYPSLQHQVAGNVGIGGSIQRR